MMHQVSFPTWIKALALLPVLMPPLTAGENELQPATREAEFQAHLERLQHDADINPLFRARLLKILPQIIQGAPVDIVLPGSKGNTALHYACAVSDIDLVTSLLRHGANKKARTQRGARPTDCADGPNRARIRRLLDEQASISTTSAPPPESNGKIVTATTVKTPATQPELEEVIAHLQNIPCAGAQEYRHKEALLKCLGHIREGKPINYSPAGDKGNTALHHACAMGDFFLAIWLLEHGASPNVRNHNGARPIDGLQGPNASFIRTHLIEYGAKD